MTFVFILIVIATTFLLASPFYMKQTKDTLIEQTSHPVIELTSQKENLLQSIRELDFDYQTGKVSAADYKSLRASIEHKTVEVMKKLEQANANWKEMEDSL